MVDNFTQVSVIILSYNHEDYISDAIKSVLSQDYTQIELIISDDHSTDNSVEVIDNLVRGCSHSSGIIIKTRFGEQNLGVIRHLNEALSLSTSDYIFLLGSDDYYKQFRISKSMALFQKFDVDVIACDATVIDKDNLIISDSIYFPYIVEQGISLHKDMILYRNLPAKEAANFVKGGFGLCFNRRILSAYNGLFPEGISHEDDFISFLGLVNQGVLFIPDTLVCYRRAGNNLSGFIKKEGKNKMNEEYAIIVEKQNTILKEKETYLLSHTISNSYYNKNKNTLIKAVRFKFLRNHIVINYCRKGKYLKRIQFSFILLTLYHGSVNVFKYFLIGIIPALTERYILKQRKRLKEIYLQ